MTDQSTVRSVTYDLLRTLKLTTVFGNPGSTEQTFLQDFPADFTYVLSLQEASVIAMADAFAQVTGRPALVNVHSSAGLGNAVGNLVAAYHGNTPLIITSGQQHRELVIGDPYLGNREATEAVGEMVLRVGPRRRRPRGLHAGLRGGAAATGGTGLPVDSHGRLEAAPVRFYPGADGERPRRPRHRATARIRRPHLRKPASRAGLRAGCRPRRRLGRGRRTGGRSFQYSVQAIYTAAQHNLPIVYVVMRNQEYSILKSFAVLEETPGVPGLDLPGLDIASVARGFGCRAVDVETTEDLEREFKTALTAGNTTVIVVPTQPQKAML
ncbi:thiamine pyrophosphate-binding protein [Streptomyces sp. NPDC058252]|uniref:thiamine pyrophosphate-binding protein n=1 Tax=Streptomyces sp. NPDC058252 TaxID=3346405 RepID=UPI0036E53754